MNCRPPVITAPGPLPLSVTVCTVTTEQVSTAVAPYLFTLPVLWCILDRAVQSCYGVAPLKVTNLSFQTPV